MKKIIIIFITLALLGTIGYYLIPSPEAETPEQEQEEVAPVFNYENASEDNIKVTTPSVSASSSVQQVFSVAGEARGNWYFEASFPITVYAEDGSVLLQTFATADGEWMTIEFVPFNVELNLGDYTGAATVVLNRDNPSGLPENDASVSFDVSVEAPAMEGNPNEEEDVTETPDDEE